MIVGASTAWAQEVTILPNDGTAVENSDYSIVKNPVTVSVTSSTLTSDQIRIFKNQTITISSETATITGVVFTCTASGTNKYGPGCFAELEGYSYEGSVGTWIGSSNSVTLTASSNQVRVTQIVVTYTTSSTPTCATPKFSPVAGTYTSAQNVTISTTTEGAAIHYTLDGTEPTANSATYSAAINVSSTTTIKAIATADGYNNSSVATATYNIVQPLTTMDAIFDAAKDAGATATPVAITFNNWVVTGVKGSNAYVTDGTKGFIVYGSNHGFEVGDELSGTATCKVQLYHGAAEITELISTTTGLSVNKEGTVTPVTNYSIADLSGVNTGAVFSFENLTYDGTNLSDGTNTIKPYTTLFSGTFVNEKSYNVTGVYLQYDDTKEILPRSAEDIEELGDDPIVFNDISDITEVNTGYRVKGTVVATNARGLVIGDGTGYVYYYKNAAVSQSVGDLVSIYGNSATYGHILQFTNTATVAEVTESNYNHTPAATVITEVPDYSEGYYLSTYLQFKGKLSKDNNSYFITLGESKIQISYPTSDQGNALTALNGKTALVKGYFTGINSNNIFTIMLESVEEVAGTDPVINAENVTLEYNATSGEIEYTIINPGTGVSLNATSDAEWISHIAIASDKVTFKTTANEGDADRTATITLTYGSVTKDITVTQGHYTTPSTEGTITFGSSDGSTQINSTSVTGSDSMGNTWTVTTTFDGEESFTQHEDCSQVGASKKPASSITFTTTLLSEITITKFEAKLGGYNDTAGDIILKVGDTEVGSGSLNGTEDVTVSNTQVATGTVLKVTVTNIAKGVKCYSISYSTNTDPYIEATVGEVLAHNATSGTVSYEVGNPVDGGVVTAATSAKWISNFVVGESTVTFDVTENTTGEDREGTITLTYTYDADKTATTDVTVSQHAAPYTLTVSDLSDVNLIVFSGDESESIINTENGESSAQVYSGTNVKISIDVETGYVLESLIVDGTDVTSQIDQTTGMYVFTMPSHNVAITATAILPSGDDYELFTGDLVEGDYIIYYEGKAMKNTVSNNRLDYVAVTPKDDVITTDNTAIVWHIAKSGDYWFIFNAAEGIFAVATGTKNQATLSETFDDKALWTVSGNETYEFVNKANAAAGVNANLRNNGTYGFACYATATGGALTLYKKAVSTKKGDLNNDGHVDIADVTALVNALKEGKEPTEGNIDGENGVNAEDVRALVEMILSNSNQ